VVLVHEKDEPFLAELDQGGIEKLCGGLEQSFAPIVQPIDVVLVGFSGKVHQLKSLGIFSIESYVWSTGQILDSCAEYIMPSRKFYECLLENSSINLALNFKCGDRTVQRYFGMNDIFKPE